MRVVAALCRLLIASIAIVPFNSEAAVIDNPQNGARSAFHWEEAGVLFEILDLDASDGVSGETGTTDWLLTLTATGLLGIEMTVYNRPPTEFALVVDDNLVQWTHAEIVPEVISVDNGVPIEFIHHFNALLEDYLLLPGEHSITLRPSLMNVDGSTGRIDFAPLRGIPEPPVLVLVAIMLVWGVARRTSWMARANPCLRGRQNLS